MKINWSEKILKWKLPANVKALVSTWNDPPTSDQLYETIKLLRMNPPWTAKYPYALPVLMGLYDGTLIIEGKK